MGNKSTFFFVASSKVKVTGMLFDGHDILSVNWFSSELMSSPRQEMGTENGNEKASITFHPRASGLASRQIPSRPLSPQH